MQMIRHHHKRINLKRAFCLRDPNGIPQRINLAQQQITPARGQIDSKEIRLTRNIHATVSAHPRTLLQHT
jgi:hypothetical protein